MKRTQQLGLGVVLLYTLLQSCTPNSRNQENFPIVYAFVETEEADAATLEDAADDPAIFVHPTDRSKSLVLGTNKKGGLSVYNLSGKELFFTDSGNPNNVDLRQGFPYQDTTITLVGCSERLNNEIWMYELNPETGALTLLPGGKVKTELTEIYGFCMYHDPILNQFYAFANDKDGTIQQWRIQSDSTAQLRCALVKTLSVPSQPEGMVADDQHRTLYVGEENAGIWRFDLKEEKAPTLLSDSQKKNTPNLQYDIEGLTIYKFDQTKGFLIASSQGNNSYAIFNRTPPNAYLGSFRIGETKKIDGTQDTDGIDVVSDSISPSLPNGFFVAQDGSNKTGNGLRPQNFKLVEWNQVQVLLDSFTIAE